jgi:hypothetical protein
MLLQSPRAICVAPGGPGSIWNYLGAPVRSAGVHGRFVCGFRTDLHFADVFGPGFHLFSRFFVISRSFLVAVSFAGWSLLSELILHVTDNGWDLGDTR